MRGPTRVRHGYGRGMDSRWESVVVDANDHHHLAHWWRQALDWRVVYQDDSEIDIGPPEGEPGVELTFIPIPSTKSAPNRIHLDLDTSSVAEQRETVEFLLDLGARRVDVGQGDAPWVVLADPEDNEFCVLDPRPEYDGTGRVAAVVCLAGDPRRMAEFWAPRMGFTVVRSTAEVAAVRGADGPFLEFVASPTPHSVKNRWHLDYRATKEGRGRERVLADTLAAGARLADIGQGPGVTWTVMADPEGNEFCLLSGAR